MSAPEDRVKEYVDCHPQDSAQGLQSWTHNYKTCIQSVPHTVVEAGETKSLLLMLSGQGGTFSQVLKELQDQPDPSGKLHAHIHSFD